MILRSPHSTTAVLKHDILECEDVRRRALAFWREHVLIDIRPERRLRQLLQLFGRDDIWRHGAARTMAERDAARLLVRRMNKRSGLAPRVREMPSTGLSIAESGGF